MSRKVDIEIFAVDELNGEKRLNLSRNSEEKNITVTATRFDNNINFQIEEKEALELASHIFRQILGLY